MVVATLAVAGCSAPSNIADVDVSGQDVDNWTLPMDPYLLSELQLAKESYAATLLQERCLKEDGLSSGVPYVDFDTAYTGRERIRSTLTRSQADQLGYHLPQENPPEALAPWRAYLTTDQPAAVASASDACSQSVGSEAQYSTATLNFVSNFAYTAFSGATTSEAVEQRAAEWVTCMAPQGIEDLPADPQEMPSPSIESRYRSGGGLDGADLGPVTEDEIALALADVSCRESTGYQQALYDGIWERETSLIDQNASEFTEIKSEIERTSAEIDDVIAKYATAETVQ